MTDRTGSWLLESDSEQGAGSVDEERDRNSVMLNLLYVHSNHPLASQISILYRQLPKDHRFIIPIDTQLSGGMNGYLWLSARNIDRSVHLSSLKGFGDIKNNLVVNSAYLDPDHHQHIPEPPYGVIMPPKVIKPSDIKSSPILWHEDNSRHHQARDRPQVTRAISGPHLEEASHRLLRNTLQLKPSTSGLLDPPFYRYHAPNNHKVNRPRPAGPSGYERGYTQDPNRYHGNYSVPRGSMNSSRSAPSFNEMWKEQNYRKHERSQYHDQYNLQTGMTSLTIEEHPTYSHLQPGMPAALYLPNPQQKPAHFVGQPPRPPTTWIDKPIYENTGLYVRQQEALSPVAYEKQGRMVYPARKEGNL